MTTSSETILGKIFAPSENVVSRKILDEMLLVPIRGRLADMQSLLTLNPVAEYIWEELNGRNTLGDILSGILETFDVDPETARMDLMEFIEAELMSGIYRDK